MNRNRLIVIGIVALAVAGLLTFAALRAMRNMMPKQAQTSQVVVAAEGLKVGAKLAAIDLRMVDYPASSIPEGAFHSIPELEGRGVVLPIEKNEPVLSSKLAADKAGAGLPTLIPNGMRAVSVKVNEVISVAGFVVPGTRVDVMLTGYPAERTPGQVMTTTVLENVEVLAAGQKLERDEAGKPQTVTVITLLVSLDDAQKLTLAASEGKIQLALRNPLDIEQEKPFAVKNLALYRASAPAPAPELRAKRGGGVAKRPASPAPPVYVVERILGNKRDEAKF